MPTIEKIDDCEITEIPLPMENGRKRRAILFLNRDTCGMMEYSDLIEGKWKATYLRVIDKGEARRIKIADADNN